jgi:hypothetical protein
MIAAARLGDGSRVNAASKGLLFKVGLICSLRVAPQGAATYASRSGKETPGNGRKRGRLPRPQFGSVMPKALTTANPGNACRVIIIRVSGVRVPPPASLTAWNRQIQAHLPIGKREGTPKGPLLGPLRARQKFHSGTLDRPSRPIAILLEPYRSRIGAGNIEGAGS